ncbi:MAG TPA: MDR family MFS transporter [Amnibacterium sp.]|jgi:EmrB/QacA subfamily drug resistance transporter|uniref:MDR family MFS transporter n=1 Tax=Amnibacterium sp. TaxID=1872496 RepID=UPI002F92367B
MTTTNAPSASGTGAGVVMTHRQILFIIFGLMSGMFLASLDQTIVGTAIRTISDDLHGLSEQAWVTTAYLITSTISTPILGKLSDIYGRRPIFLTAIGIFLVGSLLAGTAWSMYSLAVFRAVQGIGAGGLMSLALTVMGDILAPRERAKYQGYFLAVFGTSSVIGPLVGGLFAGTPEILGIAGWRWVFLINLPIGVFSLFMVSRFLHLPKRHGSAVIDWFGAVFVILALVPGLVVAEQGRTWGWTSWGAWLCYGLAAIGVVAFIITERRMKSNALIPLMLFKNRTFAVATILGVLVGFGMFGALLTVPLYLQLVQGLNPTQSGFAMIAMVAGLMISSIMAGQLISRTGKYKVFPITGTGILLLAFFYMTFVTADRPLWWALIGMFGIGLGLGQLMQTLTIASQNTVDTRFMGVATSASTFFRQIGGTVGTAVLLSVLFTRIPDTIAGAFKNPDVVKPALDSALNPAVSSLSINHGIMTQIYDAIVKPIIAALPPQVNLANAAQRHQVVDQVVARITAGGTSGSGGGSATGALNGDTSFLTTATDALKQPFLVGFSEAMVTVFWVGLVVVAVAFVLSWFLKAQPLRNKSALQEAADRAHEGGAMVAPGGPEDEAEPEREAEPTGARARIAEPGTA